MDEVAKSYELSPEGDAKIKAVDSYLEEAIRDGRPIETLIATKKAWRNHQRSGQGGSSRRYCGLVVLDRRR